LKCREGEGEKEKEEGEEGEEEFITDRPCNTSGR
jgi:hypothetical protein